MSVQAMSWVFDCSKSQYADRLVLLSIANHCNREGKEAWPLHETIALEAHISKREVIRAIQALEALGELIIVRGKGKIGRHEYQLPKMTGDKLSPTETTPKVTNAAIPGDKCRIAYKEEPSLTILSLAPPSSDRVPTTESKPKKKTSTADPRTVEFRNALEAGYARRGWRFTWGAQDGAQLKAFLARNRSLDVKEFRKWVKNYFESEGVIPGAMVYTYLAKLPNYWAGPLNQYGKLQDCAPAEVQV